MTDVAELIVRRRPAPAGQVDRVLALGEFEGFFHRLGEMLLDSLARYVTAQEIRPQEFAERRGVLGEAAGAAQFAGEAAERVVLEIGDRFRKILEVSALAL